MLFFLFFFLNCCCQRRTWTGAGVWIKKCKRFWRLHLFKEAQSHLRGCRFVFCFRWCRAFTKEWRLKCLWIHPRCPWWVGVSLRWSGRHRNHLWRIQHSLTHSLHPSIHPSSNTVKAEYVKTNQKNKEFSSKKHQQQKLNCAPYVAKLQRVLHSCCVRIVDYLPTVTFGFVSYFYGPLWGFCLGLIWSACHYFKRLVLQWANKQLQW